MSTEVFTPPGELVEAAAPVVEQSHDAQPTPEPEKMVPLAALLRYISVCYGGGFSNHFITALGS